MNRTIRVLAVGLVFSGILCGVQVSAQDASKDLSGDKVLTLEDCYALALKQSEQVQILREKMEEVEGVYLQAISTVLPKASFILTEFRQDSPAGNNEGAGSVGATFNRRSRPERKFKLSQPLFQGFRSLAAVGGSQALKGQRSEEFLRGRQLLFLDVVDAFYGLLVPRDEVESLQNIRQLSKHRITELEERVRLGRSRPSEISNATAQLRSIEAQLEQTRRAQIAWANVLLFLTGLEKIGNLADSPELPTMAGDLEGYLAKAKERADVQAARKAVEVAKQNVIIARADFFPTLSLDSNLYGKRVGFQSTTDWDVLLTFDVPLFEIVKVSGAVREAEAKAREAQLSLTRVLRLAQSEVKSAYNEFKLSVAASQAFKEAEKAAAENYDIQNKEYRLNLVNNLDVLDALQDLETARRDFLRARYQAKKDYHRLKVATGEVP